MKKFIIFATAINVCATIANISSPAWAQLVVDRFSLAPRTGITAFPVPSFKPTSPGQVIGVDAFPSAGAAPHPDNGYSWFDACDADLQHANGNVAVTCARMGVKHDRVEFGSRNFDGGMPKDVYIIRDRQIIGKFDSTGLTVFGIVKAQGFANQ